MLLANTSPGYRLSDGKPMRPYQIRAAQKVFWGTPVRNPATGAYDGSVFDGTAVHIDMGLGKTIIGLTAIVDWFKWGICNGPVLVIAPIKVCETVWEQEARQWSHTQHLRFGLLRGDARKRAFTLARAMNPITKTREIDVILVNPELLPWLFGWLRNNWGFFDALIIDDVALKDPKSKQFRTLSNYGDRHTLKGFDGRSLRDPKTGNYIYRGPHRFKRAAKLTGTPSTAGLQHLWAPTYLMDHGARIHKSYDTFEARFFHKTQQVAEHVHKVDINKEEAESRPAYEARSGAPERIHELLADITVELSAADYGILPQTLGDASKSNLDETTPTHIHRVQLPGELRADYDKLERDAILELAKDLLMAQNGGAKSMMCWQFANGAIYSKDDFGRKQTNILHDAKLDKMVELIDRLDTNILMPYWFQSDFARITERLNKEGMAFASLKGNRTQHIIDQWNGGYTPILLIHPQSASHGLNLQFGGHSVLWFTMLWSLERYLQTNARLARSGQKYMCNFHHIVCDRTTDDLMLANLRQNGSTQERFRAALREYQQLRGISIFDDGFIRALSGLGL